jgi:hypothetical protein
MLCRMMNKIGKRSSLSGKSITTYNRDERTPLHTICYEGGLLYFNERTPIDSSHIIRMLVGAGSSELLIQDYDCLKAYRGPEESLSYLLEQCFPPLNKWSLQDRRCVVSSFANCWWPNSFELIQMVLKPAQLEEIAQARLPDDTLLHLCMDRYREGCGGDTLEEGRELLLGRLKNPADPWRTFTRELIMAGECVSTLSQKTGMSPFGELMNRNGLRFADIWNAVKAWLQDLKDAGVDLEEYGEAEMSLSKSYSALPERALFDNLYNDGRGETLMRLMSYGPAVEDWVFYSLEPTDHFAGIFWKLVERQTRFGVDSRAELDFSGMNNPDWLDESDDSDWSGPDPSETEPEPESELSEMNIPGSWATFDGEND